MLPRQASTAAKSMSCKSSLTVVWLQLSGESAAACSAIVLGPDPFMKLRAELLTA